MVNAAVIDGPDGEIQTREIRLPAIGANDVRVRVAAAGVCHSDLSMMNGTFSPSFPLVLGHEASGTVVEVGADVERDARLAVGDRVVANWSPACRHCWFCLHGQPWLCTATEGVASVRRGTLADGTALHHTLGVGAFAEEVVLPANALVPLPDGVPLDLAALLGCSVLTGFGAIRDTAGVRAGESVVVVGLGGVGLAAIMAARLVGAAPIIAVDVLPDKEKLALDVGATHFVPAGLLARAGASSPAVEKWPKRIRALTSGRGADHALECVGRSDTIRAAWQSTRRGGKLTVVGIGRADDKISFGALELYHFAREIAVSVYGSADPDRDIPTLAELVTLGRLGLQPLVSQRIRLDEVPKAFDTMRTGAGARSLLIFN